MKIKSLLVGMLACTAMVSCTNDDVLENNDVIKAGEKGYIAVNIARSTGARSFEAGIDSEHAVSEAYFYFLDGDYNGCADVCIVPGTQLKWSTEGVDDHQTKKATALVVNGIKDEVPAYIVAIMNPTQAIKDLGNRPSLTQLKGVHENYSSLSTNLVMSNAVYSASNNKEVVATAITLDNIAHSEAALANTDPVTIQVERVVAKVAVDNLSEAIATLNGKLNSDETREIIDDAESMKLKFVLTGWEVLQNKQSGLIKDIDATNWTITNWNDLAKKRSYWANDYNNTENGRTKYLVGSLSGKDEQFKYVEETVNQTAHAPLFLAEGNDAKTPYLLVSGQFVNAANDEAVNLVEWKGQKYTAQGYLNLVAGMANVSKYYTAETVDGVTTYTSFSANLLELKDNTENDWGAHAVLKNESTEFYTVEFLADGVTVNKEKVTKVETDEVVEAIAAFGEVKYWNGGNAYYFVPIRHQELTAATETAPAVNYYGVVRNHVYKMNISKINGYGTPVANPEQYIDKPENPDEGDTYMQAEVVILDWKVVNNEVELN